MRILFFSLILLAVAACQPLSEEVAADDSCGRSEMGHLMGIERSQLENIAFSQPFRILPKGAAMTKDLRLDRVNFSLDENEIVVRIWCG